MGKITVPQPLTPDHDLSNFNSNVTVLDDWLKQRALKNEGQSSRTFVVLDEDEQNRVVGYFCLATGSVEHQDSSGAIKRNMPNPIPVCVLGRLAVDCNYQGQGIGAGLLKEAVRKTIAISHHIGIRALLVHALSEKAKNFYLRYGFRQSPTNEMTLMITLKEAKNVFG